MLALEHLDSPDIIVSIAATKLEGKEKWHELRYPRFPTWITVSRIYIPMQYDMFQ